MRSNFLLKNCRFYPFYCAVQKNLVIFIFIPFYILWIILVLSFLCRYFNSFYNKYLITKEYLLLFKKHYGSWVLFLKPITHVMIFSIFLIFWHYFVLQQVKQGVFIIIRNSIYEFPDILPNELRLRDLRKS